MSTEPVTTDGHPRWDCHLHVVERPERFPLSTGRGYDPPIAPLDACLRMLDRHRLTHGVLVQPSVYGFDNRCMLDALDGAGGRLTGVAVPHPEDDVGVLEAMHERGVRGVRCNLINPGGLHPDRLAKWLPFVRDAGWHVELHIAIEQTPDIGGLIDRLGVPVVIDHMGRPSRGSLDTAPHAVADLLALIRERRCFVKLSAPYRLSNGAPPWLDIAPLARALLEADPHHCLWGSDWPHTETSGSIRTPDVIAARDEWMPDPDTQAIVLGETPDGLFRLN